jgi:hypothetical protein
MGDCLAQAAVDRFAERENVEETFHSGLQAVFFKPIKPGFNNVSIYFAVLNMQEKELAVGFGRKQQSVTCNPVTVN